MSRKRQKPSLDGSREKRHRTDETPQSQMKPSGGEYTKIRMENSMLTQYYQTLLPSEHFHASFAALRTSLPASIRVNRSAPLWRATIGSIQQLSTMSLSSNEETVEEEKVSEMDQLVMKGAKTQEKNQNQSCHGSIVPWYPAALVWQFDDLNRVAIKKDKRFAKLKSFLVSEDTRGALVRQELASMIPPLFMDLQPNHLVLDLCAAPGSKTSQILDFLMRSETIYNSRSPCSDRQGGVIANEIDIKRASMLTHQLLRLGLPSIGVTCCDAAFFPTSYCVLESGEKSELKFDRILADVPCSGDGTLRKQPDIWKSWTVTGGISLHRKQVAILKRGLELLRVGGKIVYSTCSMNPIENEAVIGTILSQHSPYVELVSTDPILGLKTSPGMTTWKVADPFLNSNTSHQGSDKLLNFYDSFDDVPSYRHALIRPSMFPPMKKNLSLERCLRIYPHLNNTGGFFVAVLVKHSEFPTFQKNLNSETLDKADEMTLTVTDVNTLETVPATTGPNSVHEETATASKSMTMETSTSKRKKRNVPVGLHTHVFSLIDPSCPELIQMSHFFGFHLEPASRVTQYQNSVPADYCDLRQLVTMDDNVTIRQPTSSTTLTCMEIQVPREPPEYINECRLLLGPREAQQNFPLKHLAHREHTEKRLYYLSSALYDVVSKFQNPKSFSWVSLGTRVLERFDPKQSQRFHGCRWRLTQDGLISILPYLRQRIIFVNLTIAKPLLTGSRSLSGAEVLYGEAKGQIFNLGSCRSDESQELSKFVPGSLAVVIVPPSLIPHQGHFPDVKYSQVNTHSPTEGSGISLTNSGSEPRQFVEEFSQTNPAFLNGSLKDCVPCSCLLTKVGSIIPYIGKDEATGLVGKILERMSLEKRALHQQQLSFRKTLLKPSENVVKYISNNNTTEQMTGTSSSPENILKENTSRDEDQIHSKRPLTGGEYKSGQVSDRGIVYISHLPVGFAEHQLRKFFSQFGDITRLRLMRSRKTGHPKGYAFIEFSFKEVADIVASTMNGYMMFQRTIKCKTLRREDIPQGLFSNYVRFPKRGYNVDKARQKRSVNCTEITEAQALQKLEKEKSRLEKIKAAGIDFSPPKILVS